MPNVGVTARERADAEVLRRYKGSARKWANAAGVSNETLSKFLRDGRVTPTVRQAGVDAFDWSPDWPENPPPTPLEELSPSDASKLDQLHELVHELANIQAEQSQRIGELKGIQAEQSDRIAELSGAVAKLADEVRRLAGRRRRDGA